MNALTHAFEKSLETRIHQSGNQIGKTLDDPTNHHPFTIMDTMEHTCMRLIPVYQPKQISQSPSRDSNIEFLD